MKRFLHRCAKKGFTLLELLTVVAIIIVLAGLILAGMGYAQQKAASERARAEINALSLALESYKIDNGDYPRTISDGTVVTGSSDSIQVNPPLAPTNATLQQGSKILYQALSGGTTTGASGRVYFQFKPDMLSSGTATPTADTYVVDPFGYSYGYSTLMRSKVEAGTTSTNGFNPTFDLWSTGGQTSTSGTSMVKWITNW